MLHRDARNIALLLGILGSCLSLRAEERSAAPLFDNLGKFHFEITTTSLEAQRYFDQGLLLCYAFNHPEAIRSFEAARQLDPGAPMPYWGIGFALGPNINAGMMEDAAKKAYEATQNALKRSASASPREKALIEAMAKRYTSDPMAERAPLDRAFAEAMREVARQFPEDDDLQTIFAESLMDTMPWNYWNADGTPKPDTVVTIALLEKVLSRQPNHPGANHYYIHAVEASSHPERGLACAQRLGSLVPGAGHLVHMPSHIYLRLGMYHEASLANVKAAAADEFYESHCGLQGFYPATYYSHNVHFLWYSAAMEGRREESMRAAEKTFALVKDADTTDMPQIIWMRTVPWFARARFGLWDQLTNLPSSEHPYEESLRHFCQGLAHVYRGEKTEAEAENDLLTKAAASEEIAKLEVPLFPGASLVKIAQAILSAETASLSNDHETRIKQLTHAVALEDALPYMEPPYWYFPSRHYLGAALLDAHRPGEARTVYCEDLHRRPHNGWALFGLAEANKQMGCACQAETTAREFKEAWKYADVKLTTSRF